MTTPSTALLRPDGEAHLRSHHEVATATGATLDELDLRVRGAVAAQLRLMRRRSGLTLDQVAARASTHRPIVGRIERGVHTVRIDTAARIAEANGGSLRDVLAAIDRVLGLGAAP